MYVALPSNEGAILANLADKVGSHPRASIVLPECAVVVSCFDKTIANDGCSIDTI